MYNLGMKNIVKNKVKSLLDKYVYNILLTSIIFILFWVLGYSKTTLDFRLYINDEQVTTANGIYTINNEQYIHIDDLTNIFKDNVYDDKISGKIIITTYNNLIKLNKTDKQYVIRENENIYFNLKEIMEYIGNDVAYAKDKIYVLPKDYIEGTTKNNRVELYDKQTGNVIGYISKGQQVKVYIDINLKDDYKKIISVEANIQGKTHYGYMLKSNVAYEYITQQETGNNKKIVLVKVEDKLSTNTSKEKIDVFAVNMYRLSSVTTLTKLQNIDSTLNPKQIIATINNGQKAANYDQDIVTGMLSSEANREQLIKQIVEATKKLAGVNLDFGNLRVTDKEKYTQFVKELAAMLHKNGKMLVVNIPSTQYIDYEQIANASDYIIMQPYYARTTSSKTSGPISSIKYVEECINDVLTKNINVNKVIVEVPAYTILWTERRGTVINAEIYNMKAMLEYVKQNKLETKLEQASGQNYINFAKGITTYKMWLEDEYSVVKKSELINKYNLAGLAIYKSGMEEKDIYTSISKCLNK